MLNIKLAELQESYSTLLPIVVIFGLLFLVEFLFLFRAEFVFLNNISEKSTAFLSDILTTSAVNIDFNSFLGVRSNIKTIALTIFTDHLFSFLISSYILLLAMVAAILLTIQKSFISKSQNIYTQIMADYQKSIVNYH